MKRRGPWLLLGLLLLVLGAWLMPGIDPSADREGVDPRRLEFPRYPDSQDWEAMQRRRTLAALPQKTADAGDEESVPSRAQKRDPLLVALPPRGDLLVFEVSAFTKSPIGRMVTACLAEEGDAPNLERDGFDLSAFERVAIGNPGADEHRVIAISGKLASGQFPMQHRDQTARSYGEHGTLYSEEGDDVGRREVFATWNNELALISDDENEIRAAIDRLEGRNTEVSTFSPDNAYGEMYGRLKASAAAELLPAALREKFSATDLQVEVHADASQDVLVVADAYGSDPNSIDIGKALAAALGAQRFRAAAEGDDELSELLDAFSVERSADGFQLQAAFTQAFVESVLGDCATRATSQPKPDTAPVTAGSGG